MKRTLKTAIEYWFSLSTEDKLINIIVWVNNYFNFLKQPIQLWMFIPCDNEGKPLEKPKDYDYWEIRTKSYSGADCWEENYYNKCKEYQQACDRVLFEGFEYGENPTICFINGKDVIVAFNKDTLKPFWPKLQTINDLSGKVDLVEKVAEQFKY